MPAIDRVLPEYDFNEFHAIALRLPPSEAVAAALATPVARDPAVRLLFRLRGLPLDGTIGDVFAWLGFAELERTDSEIVVAVAGAPWRRSVGLGPFADAAPGTVRVVTNFLADGAQLSTETRIQAVDEAARRAFGRYWRVVGPFSALIRRRWLAQIAKRAA
jgi:hypothetical protein